MTDESYQQTQQQVVTFAGLLMRMELEGFLARINRAEITGPILEPTLFRNAADNLGEIKILATGLFRAQQFIKQNSKWWKERENDSRANSTH